MRKRGPNRKENAVRRNRTTVASREMIIPPTPERARMTNHYDFPLDALLAKQCISEAQHQAGQTYFRLRCASLGKPFAVGGSIWSRIAGEISGADFSLGNEAVERRFTCARDRLRLLRRRIFDVVDNTCVHLRVPQIEEISLLRFGLDELADEFGLNRSQAA